MTEAMRKQLEPAQAGENLPIQAYPNPALAERGPTTSFLVSSRQARVHSGATHLCTTSVIRPEPSTSSSNASRSTCATTTGVCEPKPYLVVSRTMMG